jgi:hypothetical protein
MLLHWLAGQQQQEQEQLKQKVGLQVLPQREQMLAQRTAVPATAAPK